MNVADMWACLQDHKVDNHWRHVAGWRKVCELADQHLGRLRTYRESLAQAWPPETNAAARAYIAELDDLIEQVRRTHDAAAANQNALSAATQAISSTRGELKKIYDEYAGKLQQKRAWDEIAADPKAAAGSRTSQPPVTDADLERLNIQARGIMYGLSGELQQAQVMLRQPPPPRPNIRDGAPPDAYGGGAAPIIPPIIPLPLPPTGTEQGKRAASTPRPVLGPAAPIVGPVLGGAGAQLTPAPATPTAPGVTPPGPTTPTPGIGIPPRPGLGTRPGFSGPVQPRSESRSANRGGNTVPNTNLPGSPRAMPPGGLIGGPPGSGFSSSAVGGTQPRRVNPIGGVIGGGAAGTSPTGGAGSRPGGGRGFGGLHTPIGGSPTLGIPGTAGPGVASTRTNRQERDKEESRRWDPDHPWQVDQGVSPVVLPPDEEGPIDPGPAIGFTR
ncbi:hypothetical protein C1I95_08500 [Micromonospora craterilacus]|uniref:PPE family domain-containing protein n=1 Tax=Micromonospora craterilacus TaxID=1655439 RepID=A0A2W2EA03_9ACTN|nr:hypothetical protein C1I95_08500 [Micromonospora craterilacus]